MITETQRDNFIEVAESLKKYRRAELNDDNGKNLLDEMYVDLLPGNVVLKKCLLNNTTFLIGRKGTGKSTIFLKLENEYRKKKSFLPCYVDVKTVFESSQTQTIASSYLEEYLDADSLNKYLMGRNFIQSVLQQIYDEIDKQRTDFFSKIAKAISGNTDEKIKEKIDALYKKIQDNEEFSKIELPVLQQKRTTLGKANKNLTSSTLSGKGNISVGNNNSLEFGTESNQTCGYEDNHSLESEFTDVLLKVFDIKNIISKLQEILKEIGVQHLVVMLDDVSEIDGAALRIFMDTIVAPLNNWSNEFIKFKVAFYPNRVHYGSIDPGKIDIINLDFYNLYSEFDVSKMEENAIDFTKRLIDNRFQYYKLKLKDFLDDNLSEKDFYIILFYASMNVPRIIGYLLSFIYQSTIIYGKQITKVDIDNAAIKYYEEKIDAFFRASTYCLLSLDEKRDIAELKKMRDVVVAKSKEVKSSITSGSLTGKYIKNQPYSSHFHVLQDIEKYLVSLELNHFISKYEEMSNRDGKKVNVYCLNYGLARKNNIFWGKPQGSEYRKYFIERPFNYTNLILNQIKEVQVIQCENEQCARLFSEADLVGLQFTKFKCPDCGAEVKIKRIVNSEVEMDIEKSKEMKKLQPDEIKIVIELFSRTKAALARDIAGEIDMNSYKVGRVCKRLSEEGIVERRKTGNVFEYWLSDYGKGYCEQCEE